MGTVDVAAVRWLASPQGQSLLRDLPPYDARTAIAVGQRYRALGIAPDLVAALLTQQLRERAREKFGEFAADLLFTADGLEQATRLEIAAAHAQRYAQASLATVHDLGCGIGADAIALAVLGVTVHAIDADAVTAAVADANLRPWPESRARVGRVEDFRPPVSAARDRVGAWLDPARRIAGVADIHGAARRVFRLGDISPSWSSVLAIAQEVPATGCKLSPSFPHDQIPRGAQAQWVSHAGALLECAIWWGPLVRSAGRTARVVRTGQPAVEVTQDQATAQVPALAAGSNLGSWLYESDRAVVQAGLVGAVTAATDGHELEPGLGYVTSDTAHDVGFARRYAVIEVLPLSIKPLRAWLRAQGITGVTIKKRGVRLDDEELRRQLRIGRGAGTGASTIVLLTRHAGRQVALALRAD